MADDLRRELTFRRLREGERRPILEVFDAMSASSRRARFHGAKPRLTETDVERLAAVGCCGREAVAAIERTSGKAVGIARYVVDDDGVAEVAYEVTDEWQGRGVGRRLIVELARLAHAQGIDRLRGLFEAGNRPALALLDHIGHPAGQDYDAGELELAVTLRA
jgi:GNAT superfamily N-acetyltransferase